jgi:hypothetical protein
VFWNLYVREKKISIENHKIFLFQVFDFYIFHKNFHPTTVSESESELFFRIRIWIQPKYSDYFGFGSTTLLVPLGSEIWDPEKNSSQIQIPYPGGKKVSDPGSGSATLA